MSSRGFQCRVCNEIFEDGKDYREHQCQRIRKELCGIRPFLKEPKDARLIAAAPELLEALKGIVTILKTIIEDTGLDSSKGFPGGYYQRALEAIAKAEGK